MKHLRLLVSTVLIAASSVQASAFDWEVGVAAGYTNNSLTYSNSYAYDMRYTDGGGFTVAVPVQMNVNDWFALRADLSYMQKNYHLKHNMGHNHFKYTNSYLQVPLMAHFSFGGTKLRGYVNAGGYLGYWTRSSMKGVTRVFQPEIVTSFSSEKRTFTDDDRRWDAGLMGGVGIEYKACDLATVFVEGNYFYSCTSKRESYAYASRPQYNNTIAIQAGVRFSLKKIFKK